MSSWAIFQPPTINGNCKGKRAHDNTRKGSDLSRQFATIWKLPGHTPNINTTVIQPPNRRVFGTTNAAAVANSATPEP
ncbi:hypothetical protein CAQU_09230 [Corynebacterium aquilae DSM 44791]|uniref:Uncharacterized protein n=1 Tax=Corynebacterium aquilae DSM 44791 TaxID=1431546 RepID=A0A1L7CHB2_9CORY|nr:hypothetical protein CAQU_09230 [Corynebacterium aquilae DSM 44791]